MNTEFQDLPNVVSSKEVQTYFGISRSTTYRIFHDATFPAPKTRTRRLSDLMNSFLRKPVVVFVSRKETMQRERHIPKPPAPRA